jgi:spore coat protein U-like protein
MPETALMRKPKRIEKRRPPRGSGVLLACIAACALFGSSAAWSASGSCSAAPTNHAFGAYDTITPTAGTSSIIVTCNHNGQAFTFNYTIALSSGSGSYATRQMTGAGDTLNFNHYTSLAHTTVWGDGTAGTATVSGTLSVPQGGAGTNASQTHTVYGLIGAPQNVTATAYATASPITVTLSANTAGDFPTATATFNTNASVAAQCNVSAANLSFGTVDPVSSQVDATTALTVNCTKNSAYTVGLDAGVTAGATIAQRLMANGADTMQYNLYTNAARSSIWGNTVGSWVSGNGAGLGIAQTLTVYGRVASGQTNLAVGNYQENTITVTVTY